MRRKRMKRKNMRQKLSMRNEVKEKRMSELPREREERGRSRINLK